MSKVDEVVAILCAYENDEAVTWRELRTWYLRNREETGETAGNWYPVQMIWPDALREVFRFARESDWAATIPAEETTLAQEAAGLSTFLSSVGIERTVVEMAAGPDPARLRRAIADAATFLDTEIDTLWPQTAKAEHDEDQTRTGTAMAGGEPAGGTTGGGTGGADDDDAGESDYGRVASAFGTLYADRYARRR